MFQFVSKLAIIICQSMFYMTFCDVTHTENSSSKTCIYGFVFYKFANEIYDKFKVLRSMKRAFVILMCMFAMAQLHAETELRETGNIHFRKVKPGLNSDKGIYRSPYHGDLVTSFDGGNAETLTLWFHYAAENAEVIITKGGETVADETFNMSANELLECDFSACESGEYTVSVIANGEIQIVATYCLL